MDRFENTNDTLILPDLYLIVRVDSHRFGSGWRTVADYPFNTEFISALRASAKELMSGGYRVAYSYTHGDEISLLLDPIESVNQRKRSRILSFFSSCATAHFNRAFNHGAVFHSKLSELPSRSHVFDYFVWQRKVSARNFLTRQIILRLQSQGLDPKEIDNRTSKLSEEERKALLIDLGFPEEELKMGDLYGYGIWWGDRTELVGSESLGVTEDEYVQLLERVAFRPVPAVDEGANLVLKPDQPKSFTSSPPPQPQAGRPVLQPVQRKGAFRLDDKKPKPR